jgi:hypothetical protein
MLSQKPKKEKKGNSQNKRRYLKYIYSTKNLYAGLVEWLE